MIRDPKKKTEYVSNIYDVRCIILIRFVLGILDSTPLLTRW